MPHSALHKCLGCQSVPSKLNEKMVSNNQSKNIGNELLKIHSNTHTHTHTVLRNKDYATLNNQGKKNEYKTIQIKRDLFPKHSTKRIHFFISGFDTLKEKISTYFRQHTRNNK